jgi:ubiquinol-cytochrome c reductase cytochrome b subunit
MPIPPCNSLENEVFPFFMKITKINPILRLVNEFLIDSPAPSNLNYLWNFGSLLGFNLVLMIVTGIA